MQQPDAGGLAQLVERFGVRPQEVARIPRGLINRTYRVQAADGARYVLQSVNAIFAPEVHEDIEAVTQHLERHGMMTPRLKRTPAGELYVRDAEGAVWRLMTYIDGESHDRLGSPAEAAAAARLLARFHRALFDLRVQFKARRAGVHDTPKHLANLERALTAHADHRLFGALAPLGREILDRARALPVGIEPPERVVHGDPKINNLLFDPATGEGRALIDLDTVGPLPLPVELGDAFRSWCNPGGEDSQEVVFDRGLFAAAIEGYASVARDSLSPDEIAAIVPTTERIMLELASRFAADALNESYFGWDASRFATRGDHNLLRAGSQLMLARSFAAQREEARAAVVAAFA